MALLLVVLQRRSRFSEGASARWTLNFCHPCPLPQSRRSTLEAADLCPRHAEARISVTTEGLTFQICASPLARPLHFCWESEIGCGRYTPCVDSASGGLGRRDIDRRKAAVLHLTQARSRMAARLASREAALFRPSRLAAMPFACDFLLIAVHAMQLVIVGCARRGGWPDHV